LSPHLDPFKERDLEVLLLVDPVDPFITPLLAEYKGKKLRNIDEASIELPALEEDEAQEDQEPDQDLLPEADFNRLVGRCVTTLGDRVLEVRQSRILKSNPVRLVAPEDSAGSDMERLQRFLDKEYQVPKRIFELNRRHKLIADLARLVSRDPQDELIDLVINQLYENGLVMEGLHPNPTSMLPAIERLLELATDRASGATED